MGFFMSWLPAFLAHFSRLLSLGPAFQHASWVCWIPDGFPNVRCFLKAPCLDTLLFSLPRTLFFPCGYLCALKLSSDLFSSGKAPGVDALVGCSSSPLGLRCSFPQHGGGGVALCRLTDEALPRHCPWPMGQPCLRSRPSLLEDGPSLKSGPCKAQLWKAIPAFCLPEGSAKAPWATASWTNCFLSSSCFSLSLVSKSSPGSLGLFLAEPNENPSCDPLPHSLG